ncbi:MAG: hypothetical protein QJR01_07680 [Kyrpidia sp.]|nr:hypothetical protein [Kyrpidia sp.]
MHPLPASIVSLAVAMGAGLFLGLHPLVALVIGAGSVAGAAVLRSAYQEVERRFRGARPRR